jgi:hypothetical protein
MTLDELVIAAILISKVPEEVGHRVVLVGRARKVYREAAPGESCSDLGVVVRRSTSRAADTCHIGTYKIVAV